jgi:hypothetical protein
MTLVSLSRGSKFWFPFVDTELIVTLQKFSLEALPLHIDSLYMEPPERLNPEALF